MAIAAATCWLSGLSSTVTSRYSAVSTHRCFLSTSHRAVAPLTRNMFDARNMFDEMPHRLIVASTPPQQPHDFTAASTLILAPAETRCGCIPVARNLFDEMPHRHNVTWNSLISAYSTRNMCREAVQLFDKRLLEGAVPDEYTFSSVFRSFSGLELALEARRAHGTVILGWDTWNVYGSGEYFTRPGPRPLPLIRGRSANLHQQRGCSFCHVQSCL